MFPVGTFGKSWATMGEFFTLNHCSTMVDMVHTSALEPTLIT